MDDIRKLFLSAPVKIIAIIISLMIIVRFFFVFNSFLQEPFPETFNLPRDAVRHVMTSLILLELLVLTLQFFIKENIEPDIIIITVLTVLGRDVIVLDFQEVDYKNLFAIGFLFAVAIAGLYFLKSKNSEL